MTRTTESEVLASRAGVVAWALVALRRRRLQETEAVAAKAVDADAPVAVSLVEAQESEDAAPRDPVGHTGRLGGGAGRRRRRRQGDRDLRRTRLGREEGRRAGAARFARGERAGGAGGRRRRGIEDPGAAGEARLRAHRAHVREGRDLEGRLRPRPHAVREQQVDGVVGGGAQDADRGGAARHRDPRAVLGHGRRSRGDRGRVRAARLAGRDAGRQPIRCASRSRCPRPTSRS